MTEMNHQNRSVEKTVRDIRRVIRRHYSAEETIRVVLKGLCGEDSIAELCRREGINTSIYYRWYKEFLEIGKKRLVETLPAKRLWMKSETCVPKPVHSKKPWRSC